jgi:DNA-directed RNA polymerase subunit RPC12/RpoP
MEDTMNRRGFFKYLMTGILAVGAMVSATGCMAPLVSAAARDKNAGDPWQCMNCGHLTRSREDLAGTRCPRCTQRMLKKITEEEIARALKKLNA